MHSTLRQELRGTQGFLKPLRSRPNRTSSAPRRSFGNQACLYNKVDPKDQGQPQSNSTDPPTTNPVEQQPPERLSNVLSTKLGSWINSLSQRGKSLQVWDTISAKDESGNWRLLPEVKKDLEEIGRTKSDTEKNTASFGIKIENGRIRPLSLQELNQERLNAQKYGKVSFRSLTDPSTDSKVLRDAHAATETAQPLREATTSIGTAQAQEEGKQSQSQLQSATGGDPSQDAEPAVFTTKFYGSSAARRQRAQRSKDKSPAYVLPDWFEDDNVLVWGEQQLSPAFPVQIQAVETRRRVEDTIRSIAATEDKKHNQEQSVKAVQSDSPREPSRLALVTAVLRGEKEVKSSEAALEETAAVKQGPQDDTTEAASPEKEQAFARGGDGDARGGSEPLPGTDGYPSADACQFIPISDSPKSRYYIRQAQLTEILTTAKGRLRLPASGGSAGIRNHLILHYAGADGDLYLDRLVEDMARRLQCNLIAFDAQDISSLITKAGVDVDMADEARMMGYDIYSDIYKDDSNEPEQPTTNTAEDQDEMDEDGPQAPQGMPFMVGKPITIDLKALFGPREGRRSGSPMMPKNLLSSMMGSNSQKPQPHLLHGLVESILSAPYNKRRRAEAEQGEKEEKTQDASTAEAPVKELSREPTMIQIKDLKAIQDTSMGKQFLHALYDTVNAKKSAGERIMLIGTECARDDPSAYSPGRIRNLQNSDPEEMSSTMVITPALPDADSKKVFEEDRNKRIQTINARHLWEMMQSKNLSLEILKPGFWTRDFLSDLDEADRECLLGYGFWSFSYVQRLAAVLASGNFSDSKQPIADAITVMLESDKTKFDWAKTVQPEKSKSLPKDGTKSEDERIAKIRSKATKHEKRLLSGVVEPMKISTTFKDIHIPPETVNALQTLTTLSLVRPDAFKYGVLASDRIPGLLLYGPPGTGKTLAAKAVARESGATMLEVSAADINDMYVGEGEKNVKALFSLARKLSPCVVFLDEADAMFSARSNQGRRVSHRELLNQFLKEWDGMSNDSGSAFIMVATNRPMDLDDAVLRRLPRRLLVDLPTEKDRGEILKIHLRNEHLASDVNFKDLASRTPFYSGSDLKNVAVAAALNCVQEENRQAQQHTGEDLYEYPEKRTLTMEHFEKALEEISASISEDMASLREIKKFDEQYGDRKGRKRKAPKWGFKSAKEADQVLDTVQVRP